MRGASQFCNYIKNTPRSGRMGPDAMASVAASAAAPNGALVTQSKYEMHPA